MSTLSTPIPARPMTFQEWVAFANGFSVTLVAERMARPSLLADGGGERLLVCPAWAVMTQALVAEDLDSGFPGVRRKRGFGHGVHPLRMVREITHPTVNGCVACTHQRVQQPAPARRSRRRRRRAIQGISACTSAVSTVLPHQIRRPGGASR